MPAKDIYPTISNFVKPKREDYDNGCETTTEEDLIIFRESRSDSPVGDWMRGELGLSS